MTEPADLRASRANAVAIGVVTALVVVAIVGFVVVWAGSWSTPPDRYADTADWIRHSAMPRLAWSLLAGVPLGAVAGTLAARQVRR